MAVKKKYGQLGRGLDALISTEDVSPSGASTINEIAIGLIDANPNQPRREFDEEGFVPSGGQAQKIAIARVFAKDPDMVILDEPSSALDPLAEYNMYNNMMKLSFGKGVIFISHRLSSARMADRIYLMKDGKVVESGTHEELISLNGYYHEMFTLQAENYQESLPEEMLRGAEAFYG